MPNWRNTVHERIASLRLNAGAEADLVEELAQHMEDRYRELVSGGMSEKEAFEKTGQELADTYPLRPARHEKLPRREPVPAGGETAGNLAGDLWRDLRYACRTMRKNPFFVLFAVLTLGLGIGANTAVFTLINTLILNPLPVYKPSELAAVSASKTKNLSRSKGALPISYADLKDYQAKNEVFSSLAGYTSPRVVTLHVGRNSQRMFAELVTGNYFSTLGLKPAIGRFFSPIENSSPGAHPVAVLNYGTWQGNFGGEKDIIGKTLRLNNTVFTVIGIAPPKFIGINAVFGPDLWIPASMAEQLLPNEMKNALSDRVKVEFLGAGRLRPGVSRAEAQANVTTIAAGLSREYPDADQGRTATVWPISVILFASSFGGSSPVVLASFVLLTVVGIVLLIACSNVANLLMARAAAREHEFALRMATGASRGRLVRQLLTESLLLGVLSGLLGVGSAYAGLGFLWSFLPSSANFVVPKLDATVLLFGLLISLLTGFVFGTVPAWRASRIGLADALKQEGHTVGKSRRGISFANTLLVGQVAFSFLLLAMAALFLRSIGQAYEIDPGFQTKHLAIVLTNPGQTGYNEAQARAFYKDLRERVAAMPGVASVSWASNLPLWGNTQNGLRIEGREQRSKADTISTIVNTVDVDYFETAGVPIDRGRAFTNIDQKSSTPVAIINEKLAHDYWPAGDALGKRIQLPGEQKARQIVGIARTADYSTLAEPPQACVYVPLAQKYSDAMTLYVRTKGDPREILLPVQREIHTIAPAILAKDARTGRQIVNDGLFQAKMGVGLLTIFGLLALGLASIGLYGILAYSVSQRKKEIGVRMALGAARSNVLRLVLKQGMSLVALGVLIGLIAALAVGRLLSRMLYGVSPADPMSIAGAAAVLLLIALVACYLPARRASRVDPLVALHES